MNSRVIWQMALRIGLLGGLAMMSYGRDSSEPEEKHEQAESVRKKTSYNLKYVACSPNHMVDVQIKNRQVVPVDQYVFVCVGDKVRWYTDDDLTFTAKFDDTATVKATTLFESGEGTFTSKPDTNPRATDKRHKQVTDIQTVSKNVTKFQDYSYQVLARDKNGKPVSTNDPHVIPM